MGSMEYSWSDIVTCSVMWPGLQILMVNQSFAQVSSWNLELWFIQVPNNNITRLEFMNNDVFGDLQVLNLEGNQLESWEEINKLGQLPW